MLIKLKDALMRGLLGEFLRYTLVGVLAFAIDYGLLLLLEKRLNVNYLIAGAAGFMMGLTVNYIGSTRFAFKKRAVKDRRLEWIAFAVIGLVGLLLNEGLLYLLTGRMAIQVEHSKPISTAVVFFWNFTARKTLLFTNSRHDKSEDYKR